MVDKKVKQKLEQFLKENGRQYYDNSIEYLGLRKRGSVDGTVKNFHIVSYMVSTSSQPYDGDKLYFACFAEDDLRLVEIVGPQSSEIFD
ncbi:MULTISPECIES: hypothetical protein [Chryseobacterium]|uniref:Uncharacterized protein n=1 Tax=Chryseobacterium camelliae TaxID=1265445 RepID=A0ABU0TMY9_9FLAO|nr:MULTISPECIES: hypothetical protein [Chryseobacterium]MDT3407740.1 hypothetical protein [Pseudacidovorax intermedius]MDQ1098409.1 hypothetical protein [Chryseobacterium camelliae]MDQ1102332.1 hypothetical protein [Chryseobacterium sp. SORGH_AS_1048]MDR6085769.1 hypothetical protein [Chryseobacterium sp. SORGH_AS_0909]MDR6130134.1 hypothetical protein [Chryseobacterium sp. SORGH_AS_1175]